MVIFHSYVTVYQAGYLIPMIFPWHSHLVLVAAMFFFWAPQVCQSWLSKLKQQRLGPGYPLHIPTVDGCEILHQLMVYPIILLGFQPSFGGAGFRNHPQYYVWLSWSVLLLILHVHAYCIAIYYQYIVLHVLFCRMTHQPMSSSEWPVYE